MDMAKSNIYLYINHGCHLFVSITALYVKIVALNKFQRSFRGKCDGLEEYKSVGRLSSGIPTWKRKERKIQPEIA